MRFILLLLIVAGSVNLSLAQDTAFNLYNPEANASLQIKNAVAEAKSSGKHVFIEVGGNWCKWCRIFYKWSHETPVIDSLFKADYVVIYVNYSKENKNEAVLKDLGFPQRFGFPVFLILDENGNRIHTQNTAYLEGGEGYSTEKVTEFLKHWNKNALSEENYRSK